MWGPSNPHMQAVSLEDGAGGALSWTEDLRAQFHSLFAHRDLLEGGEHGS